MFDNLGMRTGWNLCSFDLLLAIFSISIVILVPKGLYVGGSMFPSVRFGKIKVGVEVGQAALPVEKNST